MSLAAHSMNCVATERQDQPPPLGAVKTQSAAQVMPVGLHIPSLGIDSIGAWTPLGIQGQNGIPVTPPGKAGEIEVPPVTEPLKLGWYCPRGLPDCGAPAPGQVGPAVVLGHVNGNGKPGIFAKLARITKGAEIVIDRNDRSRVTFAVTKVETPRKADFPTAEVYGDTAKPTLRLITCGGGSNALEIVGGRRSYVNQTIVFADFVSLRPAS
jgi:hypothetical protein